MKRERCSTRQDVSTSNSGGWVRALSKATNSTSGDRRTSRWLTLLGGWCACLIIVWAAGAAVAQVVEGESLGKQVKQYLEQAERADLRGRLSDDHVTQQFLRQLKPADRGDGRVMYAQMLVALRHGDDRAVAELFAALPLDYRRSPLVLQTKILASLRLAEDIGGQREMVWLAHHAAADQPPDGKAEQARQAARFLGMACGYVAGPLERPQGDGERHLVERLAADYRADFDAGRREVAAQYALIRQRLDAVVAAATAHEKSVREREIATIVEKRDKLTAELTPLKARLRQIESDMARDVAPYVAQIDVFDEQIASIDHEIRITREHIDMLRNRIRELREAAADPDLPPEERERLLNEAARFESEVRRLQISISRRQTERTAVFADRLTALVMLSKAQSVTEPHRRAVGDLQAQINALDARENELRSAPLEVRTPEVAALEDQAQSLDTYFPDFWSMAKARILGSFGET